MNYLPSIMIGIAQYLVILPLLIYAAYFIRTKEKKKLIFYTLSIALLAGMIALLAGTLYYNPRPFVIDHTLPLFPHPADNGFPSDHVLIVGVIAASLLLFSPQLSFVVWLLALLIGYARVYSDVHHVVDIIASILISLISLGIFFFILKKWTRLQQKRT